MSESELTALLGPLLAERELELDKLDVVTAGKRRLLKVTVDGDGPRGRGPSSDQIADLTRALSRALDESDAMGEAAYTLEVSTPGISRPLTRPAHYRRNLGRLVTLTRADADDLTARIVAVTDDTVTVRVTKGKHPKTQTTTDEEIPLTEITRAVVQIEMNPPKDLVLPGDDPAADEPAADEDSAADTDESEGDL